MSMILLAVLLTTFLMPPQPERAPTKSTHLYRYVHPKADAAIAVDFGAFARPMFRSLMDLEKESFIRDNQRVARQFARFKKRMTRQLEGIKKQFGIDVFKDLHYFNASLHLSPKGEFHPMVAIKANISQQSLQMLLSMFGMSADQEESVGKFKLYKPSNGKNRPSVAWSESRVLIAMEEVLRETIPMSNDDFFAVGSLGQTLLKQHTSSNMLSFGLKLNQMIQSQARRELPPFLSHYAKYIRVVHGAVQYKGLRFSVKSEASVHQNIRSIMQGFGSFLTASEHVFQGLVSIVDGVLDPKNPNLRPPLSFLAQHKKAIFAKLVLKKQHPIRVSVNTTGNWTGLHFQGRSTVTLMMAGALSMFSPRRLRRMMRGRRYRHMPPSVKEPRTTEETPTRSSKASPTVTVERKAPSSKPSKK